ARAISARPAAAVFGEGKAQAAFVRAHGRLSGGAMALRGWRGVRQFIVTRLVTVTDGPANITRAAKRNLRSAPVCAGAEFGEAEQRLECWKDVERQFGGSPRCCASTLCRSLS